MWQRIDEMLASVFELQQQDDKNPRVTTMHASIAARCIADVTAHRSNCQQHTQRLFTSSANMMAKPNSGA